MDKESIFSHTNSLIRWIEENDYSSYDSYDLWSSKLGLLGKRIFLKNKLAGIPIVALVFFIDTFFPHFRWVFTEKERSAEAIPRIAMGYFRLYQMSGEQSYLNSGCELIRWLKQTAIKTKHGLGWGLHFDWQGREFIPKGTPCVTLTAYATEAFMEAFHLTGEKDYLETAVQTGDFVLYDLNRKEMPYGMALSYTPLDQTYVINANSSAARILISLIQTYDDPLKGDLVKKIVNYIIAQQNSDGSWYYFDRSDVPGKKNFIDSFHTCFVLQNLFQIWRWKPDNRLKESIDKGYDFFLSHFINPDFSVRHYFYYPFPTASKVDIRCCAETIYFLSELSDIYPEAIDLAQKITEWTIHHMQEKSGYFYFRIYLTHKHKIPYMRWGQAPMFNALTYLQFKLKRRGVIE